MNEPVPVRDSLLNFYLDDRVTDAHHVQAIYLGGLVRYLHRGLHSFAGRVVLTALVHPDLGRHFVGPFRITGL